MSNLFEEADATADALRRPGFSEADLQPMFRQLQKRWHPNYTDNQVSDLFEVWRDRLTARRSVERQALIGRMPELIRQRDALVERMPDMSTAEQGAPGLRVQAIANEIAASYARIQDQDRPPSPDAASWA
jgi:hypothetical protein